MKKSYHFSREELLHTIQEAEGLAVQIEILPEGQQMRLIYRWAETVDRAAKMMVQAEELLPTDDLLALQQIVNKDDEMRWEKYRRNIRWLNEPNDE